MRSAKGWKKEKVTTDKKASKRQVAVDDELGGLNSNFAFEVEGGQDLWGAEKDEVKIGSKPVSYYLSKGVPASSNAISKFRPLYRWMTSLREKKAPNH